MSAKRSAPHYMDDRCPACNWPCVGACRCPRNDRKCGNGHWWEWHRGRQVLLDGPHGRPHFAHLKLSPNMIRLLSNLDAGLPWAMKIPGAWAGRTYDALKRRELISAGDRPVHLTDLGLAYCRWHKETQL